MPYPALAWPPTVALGAEGAGDRPRVPVRLASASDGLGRVDADWDKGFVNALPWRGRAGDGRQQLELMEQGRATEPE